MWTFFGLRLVCRRSGSSQLSRGHAGAGISTTVSTRFRQDLRVFGIALFSHSEPLGEENQNRTTPEDANFSRVTSKWVSWQSDGGCTSHLTAVWAARDGKRGVEATLL